MDVEKGKNRFNPMILEKYEDRNITKIVKFVVSKVQMTKKVCLIVFFTWWWLVPGICSPVFAQNKTILVIDNFEARQSRNLLGGMSGSWEKDPADMREYCRSEFLSTKIDNKETTVLHLEYKLTPQDYNGYYIKLGNLDLRPFRELTFWIKGGKNYPSVLKIEIKNHINEVGYYNISDIKPDWKKVSLSLKDFSNITDWSKITELVFVFDGSRLGDSYGDVYVDDICFESPAEEYTKSVTAIQEKNSNFQKELEKLASLPEDEFLELIARKAFEYFWNEASPDTGFVKDRSTLSSPSSIAATGFGLAAICIGDYRKWISHEEAYARVKKILESLKHRAEKKNGFFYHFVDADSGRRVWNSEISSIDTALLLAGVIVAREYFGEPEIKNLCDDIYFQVQWPWLLEEKTKALYMGWSPETGFKGFILWDMFGEEMLLYILGLGSPTYPLPKQSWQAFRRPVKTYKDYTYIYCESESLFTYQYSHAFIDFRNRHDRYADYWVNSISAIRASRDFCMEYKDKYKTYQEGYWGISASDGPHGYRNYGATIFTHDGTVAPYAICSAIPFVPELAIPTLRKLLSNYGDKVWGKYGFTSAFNLDENWFSSEYVGIDVGISILMIENYRSEFVWKNFMKNQYIQRGLKKAGFKPGSKKIDVAFLQKFNKDKENATFSVKKIKAIFNDRAMEQHFVQFNLPDDVEFGTVENSTDLNAKFSFSWDDEYLYFVIEVIDDEIVAREKKKDIYRQDCVELYLSKSADKFLWGDKDYFQIAFAPDSIEKKPVVWAYFQNTDPSENQDVKFSVDRRENGYKIFASIRWSFLGVIPERGCLLGVSVAVHDVDEIGKRDKKINWFFKNTPSGIRLGELYLE